MLVQDLIDRSLRLIGVIAAGEVPASVERDDALISLNGIVTSWSAQQITLYQVSVQTVSLTGATSYTLGTRPARIKAASIVAANGSSKAPALVDAVGWASVEDKSRTGIWAEVLYCNYGYPSASVYLSPRPTSGSLEIHSFTPLTQFASLATTIALPDGYERALTYALALELAPEYGRPIDQAVLGVAGESKQAITALNALVLGEAQPGAAASAQAK